MKKKKKKKKKKTFEKKKKKRYFYLIFLLKTFIAEAILTGTRNLCSGAKISQIDTHVQVNPLFII